jgi:DNA-binding transcriptional regulator YdaS (Cro superfamily)
METLKKYFSENRGQSIRLSEHLGLWPSTISQWQSVPAEHVLKVEEFTGISRYDLRPDVYGVDPGVPMEDLIATKGK